MTDADARHGVDGQQCDYCAKPIDTSEDEYVELINHPGSDRLYCDHTCVWRHLDGGFDD